MLLSCNLAHLVHIFSDGSVLSHIGFELRKVKQWNVNASAIHCISLESNSHHLFTYYRLKTYRSLITSGILMNPAVGASLD